MNGRIPEEKIQEIRERTDIVEVISGYLPLKRSGDNHLGLCPFHGEKTPSFNVNASRQIFHCFGCDAGGNVFGFLMRMEGISFPDAARRLAERVGVTIEDRNLPPEEVQRRAKRERLLGINQAASEFYQRILLSEAEGESGRRYLAKRGFDGDIARQFQLGFAPGQWDALRNHLQERGFDPSLAREVGLVRAGKEGRSEYDLFRNRLLFPIHDGQGRVVGFGGRVLDESLPKYLNSPESPVYYKARVLYGLHLAKEAMRRTRDAVVVEGYFDLLALHRAGVTHAVATCGTALTADHAKLLKRYAERVILLFDQDSAGLRATVRGLEVLLPEGVAVAVVNLEAGEDPDSFLRQCGAEEFLKRLQAARPALEMFMDSRLAEAGEDIGRRARAVESILAMIRLLPQGIERNLYLKRLAERSGVDEVQLRRSGSGKTRSEATRKAPPAAVPGAPRAERTAAGLAQDLLLQLMLNDPEARELVAAAGCQDCFSDPDRRIIAEQVLAAGKENGAIDGRRLLDQLTDVQQGLLTGVLVREEAALAGGAERIFNDCRWAVNREALKRRSRELPRLIAEAVRSGDSEGQVALKEELMNINRRLKNRESSI